MNNKLIPIVITLVVGIILAGSVLMPVLTDAQKNIGPEITKSNEGLAYYSEISTDTELTFTSTSDGVTGRVNTLNGETITTTNPVLETVLLTDKFVVAITSERFCSFYGHTNAYLTNGSTVSLSVEVVGKTATITLSNEDTPTTYNLAWGYFSDSEGTVKALMSGDSAYIHSMDDIVLGGYYATGDNDTRYYFHDGSTYASVYEMNVTADLKTADGTTDILEMSNLVVDIGDETFTPYNILVPVSVEGHAASGASYSLLGAIPILVIVALILGAVGMIAVRRND